MKPYCAHCLMLKRALEELIGEYEVEARALQEEMVCSEYQERKAKRELQNRLAYYRGYLFLQKENM